MAFIARDRPSVAVEWYEGLIERIELLRDLPEQGRVVAEWHEPTVREILRHPYRLPVPDVARHLALVGHRSRTLPAPSSNRHRLAAPWSRSEPTASVAGNRPLTVGCRC